MSDQDQDPSQKTEEATPRRLEKSREEGQVAKSREVNSWLVLAIGTAMLATIGPFLARQVMLELSTIINGAGTTPASGADLVILVNGVAQAMLLYVLLPCFMLSIAGITASLFQHGLLFTTKPITPKMERIDPLKGLKRLFSQQSLVEFVKGLTKILIVGVVGFLVILPDVTSIETLVGVAEKDIARKFVYIAAKMMAAMLAVYFFITVSDTLYQFYAHRKRLRMSRQELKEEFKQSEGDPQIKARIRQIRNERHRRRLVESMAKADVVITNPTHYAVALSYKPDEMEAPEVVAKGLDNMALLIRRLAEERSISIIENPPLARALHDTTEEGEQINPKHYKAVAAIISKIFRLKNKSLGS